MTETPSSPLSPADGQTPRRAGQRKIFVLMSIGVVVAAVVTSYVFGRPFWTGEPAEATGGGPPPTGFAPTEATDGASPLMLADIPPGQEVCSRLTSAKADGVLGTTVTPDGPCGLNGEDGVQLTVEPLDLAHLDAFVAEAESWDDAPEVVQEPWTALFFVDGERSALLIDGGDRSLVLRLVDRGRDRSEHLAALLGIAGVILS